MVILSSSTNNDTLNTQQVQIQRNGTFVWTPAGTEQMRLSSSGNLGIGQTSPSYRLDVVNATGSGATTSIRLNNPGTAAGDGPQILFTSGTSTTGGCAIAGYGTALNAADMVFYSGGNTERMRLDSSGRLLVGVTSYSDGSLFKTDSGNTALNAYRASSSTSSGIFAVYSDVGGTQTIRAYLRLDGGLANYSANNLNLSDERLKKNITPASDYLAKICAIPVKTFLYKDQAETEDLTLGVIAQDVQSIAPELVSKSGFGVNDENKLDYLSIYQTDLQYALMKSIQELSALVTAQSATITSLTERITALEGK
jgi:hypothetical protein